MSTPEIVFFGLAAGVATVVGIRLLAVASRSREIPELSHALTAVRVGFGRLSALFSCGSFLMLVIEIVTDTARPQKISPISMGFALGASALVWLAFYSPRVHVTWALRGTGQA